MNQSATLQLSIIIVNWNAGEYLQTCLHSLQANALPDGWEIIVVDNASTDSSIEAVKSAFPAVRLLRNQENVGFAAANNLALPLARGEFVLLLNPDTEVAPNTLMGMMGYLREHPHIGVVGPRLMDGEGRLQGGAAGYDPSPHTIFNYAFFLYQVFPHSCRSLWLGRSFYNKQQPIEVDWVSGAALMARNVLFTEVGHLSEDFFMYVEDIEWCRRVRAAGWQIHVLPMFTVIHHIGRSARQREAAFYAANIESMDIDYRHRFSPHMVLWLHVLGCIGFTLRYFLYTYFYWRWRTPIFAELRSQWHTCASTSLHLAYDAAKRWLG